MTLLFIDSFDHYSTGESDEKGYSLNASPPNITAGTGRRGTNSMRSDYDVNGSTVTQSFVDSDTIVVGAAISFEAYVSNLVLDIKDLGGNSLAQLETTTAGEFRLISGGVTLFSAINAHNPQSYSYYELKYVKGTGANAVAELRKDAVVILTISTSTETAQASACVMLEGWKSGSRWADMDDLYILNGLTATNNDYLGDVRVDAHYTSADGVEVEFSPNTGASQWTHVDDITPDGELTFVEAGTINNRDIYAVDSASLGTVIHGVQQVVLNRKTDAGIVTVDLITEKSGGAGEQVTDTDTASDDYLYQLAILELDQDDDVTWTDARVNATEFGFKINNIET